MKPNMWMWPTAGTRGEEQLEKDSAIAHSPALFQNQQWNYSLSPIGWICVCVGACVTVCVCASVPLALNYTLIIIRLVIDHPHSQYWSSAYHLAEGHETLSVGSGGTESMKYHREGNHYRLEHVVQMTIFKANKVSCSWIFGCLLSENAKMVHFKIFLLGKKTLPPGFKGKKWNK